MSEGHIEGLRGPALVVPETNLLDRSHFVDDPRTSPAMVRHLISGHGRFLDG